MPTAFSHAIAASALGQLYPKHTLPPRFWIWTVVCAVLPDVDVIGFPLGIRYDDMLGHRGLTHSLPFAALVGLVVATKVAKSNATNAHASGAGSWSLGVLWVYFAAITASHGLLDALTDGGRGVAFFAPVSNHRFFFPWRPIHVSPIGVGFFSRRGLDVLRNESLWILLPSAVIALLGRTTIRRRERG